MLVELRKLIVHKAMGLATGEDHLDWALAALEAGQDSEHLRMLAGLGAYPHWQEVRDYFGLALEELGLELPPVEQIMPEYVRDVAGGIVSGTINPNAGCREIYWALLTDRLQVTQEEFEAWLYLGDGLEPGTYRSLRGAELGEAIRREAARLLEAP